jgi:hypothetical protein
LIYSFAIVRREAENKGIWNYPSGKRARMVRRRAFLALTADEVIGDLKEDRETLRDSDDTEMKERVTRIDMEQLLVNDNE